MGEPAGLDRLAAVFEDDPGLLAAAGVRGDAGARAVQRAVERGQDDQRDHARLAVAPGHGEDRGADPLATGSVPECAFEELHFPGQDLDRLPDQ